MHVERVKYVIWAADLARATNFYQTVFGASVFVPTATFPSLKSSVPSSASTAEVK